jgi:short-subunit dehydrogenase
MKEYALITGASFGIGRDLSYLFAEDKINLILVARNFDKLKEISNEIKIRYNVDVLFLAKDLTKEKSSKEIYEFCKNSGIHVTHLVNNAGIGTNGDFADESLDDINNLIKLNINSLVNLTRFFLPDMIKNHEGGILNVASTASFQPGPFMANYYASKAYVLSFSEAIREEVLPYHINVSVLCPGPTKTEFFNRANMEESKLINLPLAMTSEKVAKIGYKGYKKKKDIIIPGWINNIMVQSLRISHRAMVRKIAGFLNHK